MAKYGSFKYSTAKYGTGAAGTQPTFSGSVIWVCGVSWNGTYSGTPEKMVDFQMSRGSAYSIAASGGGFEPLTIGSCTIVLDNSDGRYDPYNSESALYPNVAPGKKIFIDAIDISSGVHYQRFTGRITDIIPDGKNQTVTIECKDTANDLERDDITLPFAFSTNTSDALASVLGGLGWGWGESIQTSDNPLTLFTVDEQNGLGVVDALVQGSMGVSFIAKDGRFIYYDRDYDSQASHSVDQAVVAKDLPIKSPWDTTRRNIAVYANKWARTPIKTIWTCPDSLFLAVGETKTFSIELPNPSQIIPPVSGVDYPDALGIISISGGVVNTGAMFSVSISNVTGKGCTFTIHNNANAPQFLYNLRLRGREYVQSYSTKQERGSWRTWVPTIRQDTSTKKKYTRTNSAAGGKFVLDNPYLQDGNFADAYAASISTALETPDKAPTLKFDTRPSEAFPIELWDKIVVTSSKLGINNTFYVLQIEEHWTDGQGTGQGFETIIRTGRRILCTASITPEPIPEDGSGDGPINTIPTDPIGTPTTPGTPPETYPLTCMQGNVTTGPYPLEFDRRIVNPGQSSYAMFPCGIRDGSKVTLTYQSRLDLLLAQAYGNAYQYYQTFAIDANKNRILAGTHSFSFFDKDSYFAPPGGLSIAGFEVFLPSSPPIYTPGFNWYSDEGIPFSYDMLAAECSPYPPAWIQHSSDLAAFHGTWSGGQHFRLFFDYGSVPNNSVNFYIRFRKTAAIVNAILMHRSFDGINYVNGNVGDDTINTWSTAVYLLGGARYMQVQVAEVNQQVDFAYAYFSDTSAPITGYIDLNNANRVWNVCATPEASA